MEAQTSFRTMPEHENSHAHCKSQYFQAPPMEHQSDFRTASPLVSLDVHRKSQHVATLAMEAKTGFRATSEHEHSRFSSYIAILSQHTQWHINLISELLASQHRNSCFHFHRKSQHLAAHPMEAQTGFRTASQHGNSLFRSKSLYFQACLMVHQFDFRTTSQDGNPYFVTNRCMLKRALDKSHLFEAIPLQPQVAFEK